MKKIQCQFAVYLLYLMMVVVVMTVLMMMIIHTFARHILSRVRLNQRPQQLLAM